MNDLIFQDAVSGLTEYYPFLMDESLVGEFESCIKYPNSGNNQLDYENVKAQLEKLCRKFEYLLIYKEVKRMP